MREIKFRGRAKEPIPDKWFYGGYVRKGKKRTKHYIVNWYEKNMKLAQVDPKSIGQYTGLKDKNGTEIYEGDIVKFNDFWGEITGGNVGDTIRTCFVEYIMSGFFLRDVLNEEYEEDLGMALINDDEFEVIGNVFQNGGLLNDS